MNARILSRCWVVTAGNTHNHFVFHHQGCVCDAVAPCQRARGVPRVGDSNVPKQLSLIAHQSRGDARLWCQGRVFRQDCETAIRDVPGNACRNAQRRVRQFPQNTAGGGVERDGIIYASTVS